MPMAVGGQGGVVQMTEIEARTHEKQRPLDPFWSEYRYRRDLTVIRRLISIALVVSLLMPAVAGAGIAAAMSVYAFFYRKHIGLRWMLLSVFFTLFYISGIVIRAVANRPEVETLVGR